MAAFRSYLVRKKIFSSTIEFVLWHADSSTTTAAVTTTTTTIPQHSLWIDNSGHRMICAFCHTITCYLSNKVQFSSLSYDSDDIYIKFIKTKSTIKRNIHVRKMLRKCCEFVHSLHSHIVINRAIIILFISLNRLYWLIHDTFLDPVIRTL